MTNRSLLTDWRQRPRYSGFAAGPIHTPDAVAAARSATKAALAAAVVDPDACRYAGHPLHICTRRDGRVLLAGEAGVCHVEARMQTIEQAQGLAVCDLCDDASDHHHALDDYGFAEQAAVAS